MKTQYYYKNIDITAGVREKIEKKLAHLRKYEPALGSFATRVDISRDTHHQKGDVFRVEINARAKGHLLRAVEEADDILLAADLSVNKIERQARDYKDKIVSKRTYDKNINANYP